MKLAPALGIACWLLIAGCPGGGGGDGDASISDGGMEDCPVGSESCECTAGGACDPGLTCASQVCVNLGGLGGQGGSGAQSGAGGQSASGGQGGAGGSVVPPSGDPLAVLNAMVILPNEGAPLMNPEIDETVTIDRVPLGETQPLMMGSVTNVSLPFSAPMGNVVAAGIRFGATGPIRTVMLPDATLQTNATLAFDMQIPASVCADLANICHDIQCYEFAVTDAGRVSRENIMDVALMCGNCTEPTCQALLPAGSCSMECVDPEDCEVGQACDMGRCVGEGALRFTLTWSAMSDLDLYVRTPSGLELSYTNRIGDSGELDRDDTAGGPGAVENVFFTAPPVGTYTYFIRNFSGREDVSYSLQVSKQGSVVATQTGSVPAVSAAMSPEYTISVP